MERTEFCSGKGMIGIMKRRVVVTGLGAVTPIGNTVDEFWAGIKEGKVGIGPITKFDASDFKVQIAAEVKGFVAKERMDFKAAKRMEPFSQYAVAAAKEAFEDAGMDMTKEDPFRVGVIVGSGIGSLQAVEREHQKLLEKGPGRVNPLLVPMMISNMAAVDKFITGVGVHFIRNFILIQDAHSIGFGFFTHCKSSCILCIV